MHISDNRFREIVLSASHAKEAPAVLSVKESKHFHACAACIDRLGDSARQIFEERFASASPEDDGADTGRSNVKYPAHGDETTEEQS